MNLTAQQLNQLIELFANDYVNNLTLKECQELIFNNICEDLDNLLEDEILEQIESETNADYVDKLLEHVTSNDKNRNNQL
tara:strand:+ start:280 stop:519 length:240 start_codon:yes stop_codon:yes gene_type:complete